MTDDEFLGAFERAAIPAPQWTHAAHVRMAYLYARRFGFDLALDHTRRGINALNGSHVAAGFKPRVGYHETITAAWLRLIVGALRAADAHKDAPAASWAEFSSRHPHLLDPDALLRHYSRERLMSPAAKAAFIEPDLAPLP